MNWIFADNGGGEESGFHHAGVETFKGRQQSLAREIIQNSLDARVDPNKPVKVRFEVVQLKRKSIPDVDSLTSTFKQCAKYWSTDAKASKFFKEAEKLSLQPTIAALKIGDYNTSGLLGDDDDRKGNWFNLIRCSGSSSKLSGEGGSFGIGKNAPFAASKMRVVLYSTYNSNGDHAFQGVARLVTHQVGKRKLQATGYLGLDNGNAIRSKSKIPKEFRRSEEGTDVVVLGFDASAGWENDLIRSVLDSFWPAIHFRDLEVEVGDRAISAKTLDALLGQFSADEDFTAHTYYRAFTSPEAIESKQKLPSLKEVSLKLLAGQPDSPKRVAMVRKTGMVIELKQFRSVVPFCGVFMCRNNDGNAILRDMEPPRHDEWNPDHPEKGANRLAYREFVEYIREQLAKLAPQNTEKTLTIPELSQFLPDDEDSPEQGFDGNPDEKPGKSEGFTRKPEEKKIDGRPMRQSRKAQPDSTKPDAGEADIEQGGDGDGDGGGGQEHNTGGGGDGGGGQGDGKSKQGKGRSGGAGSKPVVPVRFRAFPSDPSGSSYRVTVSPEKPTKSKVLLSVAAVGDDTSSSLDLTSAAAGVGQPLPVNADGSIGPIQFPAKGSLTLNLMLKKPRRFALEVVAHEA